MMLLRLICLLLLQRNYCVRCHVSDVDTEETRHQVIKQCDANENNDNAINVTTVEDNNVLGTINNIIKREASVANSKNLHTTEKQLLAKAADCPRGYLKSEYHENCVNYILYEREKAIMRKYNAELSAANRNKLNTTEKPYADADCPPGYVNSEFHGHCVHYLVYASEVVKKKKNGEDEERKKEKEKGEDDERKKEKEKELEQAFFNDAFSGAPCPTGYVRIHDKCKEYVDWSIWSTSTDCGQGKVRINYICVDKPKEKSIKTDIVYSYNTIYKKKIQVKIDPIVKQGSYRTIMEMDHLTSS